MSAIDWAADTGQRLREDPVHRALRESVADFIDGARARWAIVEMVANQGIVSSPLHPDATFEAMGRQDIRRAKTLCGEVEHYRALEPYLCRGNVFWDVGAYNGHYSVLAALNGCDVVAFEPNSTNHLGLKRNVRLNGVDIELRDVGLSDEERDVTMEGPSLSEGCVADGHGPNRVVRGDDIGPWPDVVKIDVEGHETQVLDGMQDILGGVTAVAVEVHEGDDAGAVAQRLETAGLLVREPETTRQETHLLGVRD